MEKRIISDDLDQRPATCELLLGGNGDYYIVVKEDREGIITANSCRVSTSGGQSSTRIKIAVANLYRAINDETEDLPVCRHDWGEMRHGVARCIKCGKYSC